MLTGLLMIFKFFVPVFCGFQASWILQEYSPFGKLRNFPFTIYFYGQYYNLKLSQNNTHSASENDYFERYQFNTILIQSETLNPKTSTLATRLSGCWLLDGSNPTIPVKPIIVFHAMYTITLNAPDHRMRQMVRAWIHSNVTRRGTDVEKRYLNRQGMIRHDRPAQTWCVKGSV